MEYTTARFENLCTFKYSLLFIFVHLPPIRMAKLLMDSLACGLESKINKINCNENYRFLSVFTFSSAKVNKRSSAHHESCKKFKSEKF